MHDNSSILSPGLPVLRYDQGVIALEGYPGDPGRNLGIKWKHQTETNRWVAFASEYRKAKKEGSMIWSRHGKNWNHLARRSSILRGRSGRGNLGLESSKSRDGLDANRHWQD